MLPKWCEIRESMAKWNILITFFKGRFFFTFHFLCISFLYLSFNIRFDSVFIAVRWRLTYFIRIVSLVFRTESPKQYEAYTHLESFHLLQRGTFLYSYSLSLLNFLKRLQLFNAWVSMSKCLTRLFHYVKQYISLPELKKYISFILAHYSLGNCVSSIILTTWILTAPDSLGEAPASLQTLFSLRLLCHLSCPS